MGVYNPLVDMPVSCAECFTRGGSNCFLDQQMSYSNVLHSRHPDCPLVEVKAPHGDLVDRDALIDNIKKAWDWETVNGIDTATALRQTICDVKNAPTVLEAEGKDDG